MAEEPAVTRLGRLCRSVAVGMVARLWPGQDQMSLEARLASLPVGRQAALVGMALGALLAGAFVAATYGWIGILVYFGVVMLLVG